MKYVMGMTALLLITLTALAVNVWFGLAFGNPFNWAVCVVIAPLAIYQLALLIRMSTR